MPVRKSTVRGREFGDAMRALLKAANLTNRAAAELLGWDEAKVSELVNGKDGTTKVDMAQLLGLLRTPPAEFAHLMALHQVTHECDWVQPTGSTVTDRARTLREHEKIASAIVGWSMNVVHGLLQVPSYALHVGTALAKVTKDELPAYVSNRTARQDAVLDGRRTVTIYMHEQALRLQVGGPDVMSEQLHHLLRLSVWTYLSIRVVPAVVGPHAGLAGDFDLLTFKKIPPIVYVESEGANFFLEDRPSVGLYDKVLKSLERTALDEVQTRKLINGIVEQEASHGQVAQE